MDISWPTILAKRLRRKRHLSTQRELYARELSDGFVLPPSLYKLKAGKKVSFFKIDEDLDIKKTASSGSEGKAVQGNKSKLKKGSFLPLTALNIGFSVVTPIISCLILGLLLDNIYGTKPIFTSVFILIGSLGSFYNLLKIVKENRL